ncbi:MAG: FAD/NAD(P)-binding protein [Thermodesulfovibrionales bacterium]|nr:FAD/NAD(P)-binding protein [Thermodesulfovibrionales bacterium]
MASKLIPVVAEIKWIKKESRDTATYALKILDKDVNRDFKYEPGQFSMLSVVGIGEVPISFSSAPTDRDITHTIRIAGDVTTALSKLKVGDLIGVRGPFGRGWPLSELYDREPLIIAGGIGIAPMRSMIREIVNNYDKYFFRRTPVVVYGARTPKDILFRNEFPRYRGFFELILTVDSADPEEYWKGEIGFVTNVIKRLNINPLHTTAFICGPEIMMQSTIKELLLKGVAREKIFLSMERNMNCGIGLCGHCLFGPKFICKDGPVFRYIEVEEFLGIKEL